MKFGFFRRSLLFGLAFTAASIAFSQAQTDSQSDQPANQPAKPIEQTGKKEMSFGLHKDFIPSVAFSPDGKRLASAGDHQVKIIEAETGKELLKLKGSRDMHFFSVAFSPDGTTLAGAQTRLKERKRRKEGDLTITTLFYLGEVLIWDAKTGAIKATLSNDGDPAWAATFSPDGKWLAVATGPITDESDKECKNACIAYGEIQLWETASWTLVRRMRGKSAAFRSVAFSPDGQMIAGGAGLVDGHRGASTEEESRFEVFLWEAATGELKQTLPGHTGAISSLAFSPDGSQLASAGRDRGLKLWDCQTYTLKKTASDYMLSAAEIGSLSEAAGGKGKRALPPVSWLVNISFSRDGKQLIGGSNDGVIRVYDVNSATITSVLKPRGWPLFDPRSQRFELFRRLPSEFPAPDPPTYDASVGSTTNNPMRGSAISMTPLTNSWPFHSGSLNSLAVSSNGKTLALGCADGKLRLIVLD